jgi:hypothetical protein
MDFAPITKLENIIADESFSGGIRVLLPSSATTALV